MNNDDALIHLRVPRETKGRWVAASRAQGQKLTDWIVQCVDRQHVERPRRLMAGTVQQAIDAAGLTQVSAAHAIDIDPRTMRRYIAGDLPTPRSVMLALAYLAKE